MTEAQKYQGALYKEKPTKSQKRKSVTIAENAVTHKPREAYVEDAPDADGGVPPPAPSPPPATPALPAPKSDAKAVNVFDFQDPSTPETPANGSREQMKMLSDAPSIFDKSTQLVEYKDTNNAAFEEDGFCYGSGPIPPAPLYNQASNVSMEFVTPAPSKADRRRRDRDQPPPSLEHSASSLIGKRKRGQPEDASDDVSMVDAPAATPQLNHSGLTGGLSQMMRMQSPDYRSDEDSGRNHPVSPVKRTRRNKETHSENGLGISMGQKLISLIGGATGVTSAHGSSNDPTKALVRSRRHSSSDDGDKARKATKKKSKDKEKEKKDKKHKSTSTALVHVKHDSDSDTHTPPRRLKAIEYKRRGDGDDRSRSPRANKHRKDREREREPKDKDNQMVLYKDKEKDGSDSDAETDAHREKAAAFLALVNKGPESERGYSVHKALRKFHREVVAASPAASEDGKEKEKEKKRGRSRHRDRDRGEEEELWRMLRLKRNDRGEVVVFI